MLRTTLSISARRAIIGATFRPHIIARCASSTPSYTIVETKPEEIKKKQYPTSPHLTIYRLPLPAWLSITFRGTGMALSAVFAGVGIGMLGASHELVYYINQLQQLSPLLPALMKFAIAFPTTYHFVAGARHLMWDSKPWQFLTIRKAFASGYIVMGLTAVISIALAFTTF
eukprot:TRINITY_DN537_c0_g1_i1.p1 TRINITY_DN537_c0_g1~~TRINITY_DN537_c0_g1_i1.p1  ORF type:complete len:171 (+),score=49.18 TRINITY_DN537_c0_g1_i1:136-648(+)